jgi:hypothetical protein
MPIKVIHTSEDRIVPVLAVVVRLEGGVVVACGAAKRRDDTAGPRGVAQIRPFCLSLGLLGVGAVRSIFTSG